MYNYPMFYPTEIIFAPTDACNLHCPHCFVSRTPHRLEAETAVKFLESCISCSKENPKLPKIEKIGFSGGEPFLYMDFLIKIISFAIKNDFMFDQIMTNGDWWTDEADLTEKLTQLYNAGYDGKIGLSWDSFHNQKTERIQVFIKNVHNIFGEDSINIQTVVSLESVAKGSYTQTEKTILSRTAAPDTPLYILPQSFQSSDARAWQAKKWFKDDYCEGPGQILYIHPDGNIAPCCGFANENSALFIGNINDSFSQVMEKASANKMIEICYEKGLGKFRKKAKGMFKKKGIKYPGKCDDICSFCDFVAKNL